MNVNQLKANYYNAWNWLGIEDKNKQIKMLGYIERLASLSKVDIQGWDINKEFGEGTANRLLTDHAEINRRFFEKREKIAAEDQAKEQAGENPAFSLPGSVKAAIEKQRQEHIDHFVEEQRGALHTAIQQATEYACLSEEYIQKASHASLKIHGLTGEERPKVSDEIEKIVRAGFWSYFGYDSENVFFESRGPIVLSCVNDAAGINLTVNLGRFRLLYGPSTAKVRLLPHQNNLVSQYRCHPHVYSDGRICYGGAHAIIPKLLANGEVANAVRLITQIITEYNPNSPLWGLSSYVKQKVFNPDPAPPPVFEGQPEDESDEHYGGQTSVISEIDGAEVEF